MLMVEYKKKKNCLKTNWPTFSLRWNTVHFRHFALFTESSNVTGGGSPPARQRRICRESPPLHVSSQLCLAVSESVSLCTLLVWCEISVSASYGWITVTTTPAPLRHFCSGFTSHSSNLLHSKVLAGPVWVLQQDASVGRKHVGNARQTTARQVIPVSPVGLFLRGQWLQSLSVKNWLDEGTSCVAADLFFFSFFFCTARLTTFYATCHDDDEPFILGGATMCTDGD